MQNTTFCKHCATARHVGENTMMEGCTASRSFSRLLRDCCRYSVALAYDMRAGQPLAKSVPGRLLPRSVMLFLLSDCRSCPYLFKTAVHLHGRPFPYMF